jgi:hypothetical protein
MEAEGEAGREKKGKKGDHSRRGKPESSADANLQRQGHYPRRKEQGRRKRLKVIREDEGES